MSHLGLSYKKQGVSECLICLKAQGHYAMMVESLDLIGSLEVKCGKLFVSQD